MEKAPKTLEIRVCERFTVNPEKHPVPSPISILSVWDPEIVGRESQGVLSVTTFARPPTFLIIGPANTKARV